MSDNWLIIGKTTYKEWEEKQEGGKWVTIGRKDNEQWEQGVNWSSFLNSYSHEDQLRRLNASEIWAYLKMISDALSTYKALENGSLETKVTYEIHNNPAFPEPHKQTRCRKTFSPYETVRNKIVQVGNNIYEYLQKYYSLENFENDPSLLSCKFSKRIGVQVARNAFTAQLEKIARKEDKLTAIEKFYEDNINKKLFTSRRNPTWDLFFNRNSPTTSKKSFIAWINKLKSDVNNTHKSPSEVATARP